MSNTDLLTDEIVESYQRKNECLMELVERYCCMAHIAITHLDGKISFQHIKSQANQLVLNKDIPHQYEEDIRDSIEKYDE